MGRIPGNVLTGMVVILGIGFVALPLFSLLVKIAAGFALTIVVCLPARRKV